MKQTQLYRPAFSRAGQARLLGVSLGNAVRLLFRRDTVQQWRRLLEEGIDPVVHLLLQANNTAIINQWLDNGGQVAFLSSFPRSGNTWMRYMLSDILLQMHQVETTTKLPVAPDDLVPTFCYNSIGHRLGRCPQWAVDSELSFIKTHASFSRLEQIVSSNGRDRSSREKAFRGSRVVYLYRTPEDALVSLYHLKVYDTFSRSRDRYTLEEFCRKEVSAWIHNIQSYISAAEDGHPVFFISYEQLLQRTTVVLTDMLRWMGVTHDEQIVPRAVSNMRFCNLQAMEKEEKNEIHPANENALFFRRGCSGSGRAELRESTLKEIRERSADLLNKANQLQSTQNTEFSVPVMRIRNKSTVQPAANGKPRDISAEPQLQRL